MTPITPTIQLRKFLEIPYDELEELNLAAKKKVLDRVAAHKLQEEIGRQSLCVSPTWKVSFTCWTTIRSSCSRRTII
jgi:hypothetical protein